MSRGRYGTWEDDSVITCLLDRKHEERQAAEEEAHENELLNGSDHSFPADQHTHEQPVHLPALIVCPTSLLGNWQRELKRFAPDLSLYIHHGGQRLHGNEFQAEAQTHDIVLTTYHLAGKDGPDLASLHWSTIVLDEAQYIKNYRTKQAQSVMRLSTLHRIAMTGTPVENRLSELWSIFQFLNPGYLGTASSFRQRYTGLGPSEENAGASLRELHRLVSPLLAQAEE